MDAAAWSPDGRSIAVGTGDQLQIMTAPGDARVLEHGVALRITCPEGQAPAMHSIGVMQRQLGRYETSGFHVRLLNGYRTAVD